MFTDPSMNQLARLVGKNFQQQFSQHQHLDEPASNPSHEHAIGQVLLMSLLYDAPTLAIDVYNGWAGPAGYTELAWLGTTKMANGNRVYMFASEVGVIGINQDFRIEFVNEVAPVPVDA